MLAICNVFQYPFTALELVDRHMYVFLSNDNYCTKTGVMRIRKNVVVPYTSKFDIHKRVPLCTVLLVCWKLHNIQFCIQF